MAQNITLKLGLPTMPFCPKCQGKMVLRESKKERFWSCQRYPECECIGIVALDTPSKAKGYKLQSDREKKRNAFKALFS
ncbi:topoisomerase DNA-binding C4 zinc finger domain-containing protein [Xenorhabdus sp. PB62.4]|uniref:topoisomerase DNA-binding C4 zinc finger domain-containing protein n=1 Tax=Xenorhabdus sp. PB62.4 TaxID=1851573 RepID=UPI0021079026|nr:topoisomerase DNA-binding C4 zinc finger domain-containing protein [Xenorhabdus sp. PB62.4]